MAEARGATDPVVSTGGESAESTQILTVNVEEQPAAAGDMEEQDLTGRSVPLNAVEDQNIAYSTNAPYGHAAQQICYGGYGGVAGQPYQHWRYINAGGMGLHASFQSSYYNPWMSYISYYPVATSPISIGGQVYYPQQFPLAGSYYQQPVPPVSAESTQILTVDVKEHPAVTGNMEEQRVASGRASGIKTCQFVGVAGQPYQQWQYTDAELMGLHVDSVGHMYSPRQFPLPGSYYQQPFPPGMSYRPSTIPVLPFPAVSPQHTLTLPNARVHWSQQPEASYGFSSAESSYSQDIEHASMFNVCDRIDENIRRGPRFSRHKNPKLILDSDGKIGNFIPATKNYSECQLELPTHYKDARFFILKSICEDNIHRSIKYGVWTSTNRGNHKLDAAYREAKAKEVQCRVFLLFSVTGSGSFCGVAEMIGPVNFNASLDYWQQDNWNGHFPLKWHMIKDVPLSHFGHIVLENSDNQKVAMSTDTQEVAVEQGFEILNIFKNYDSNMSIVDDFDFYDKREEVIQKIRSTRNQSAIQLSGTSTTETKQLLCPSTTDEAFEQLSSNIAEVVELGDESSEKLQRGKGQVASAEAE